MGPSSTSSGAITTTRLVVLFIGLALAVFVAALDETIVAVAAIYISGEFNSFPLYSWVTVSYLVTLVAAQTVYGAISNIVGRKGPMIFAACVFLLASVGCGWAPNMPFFIAARALSGFGAGGMNGLSFIIVLDTFPLEERPKYQSILLSGFGAAAVTGPIIGGVIALFAVALVSLVLFIIVEKYIAKDRALIPMRLMQNRALLAAWASLFLLSVDFTSFLYYIPTWFQLVQAHDAAEAGLQLLPYLAGMVVVGILQRQTADLAIANSLAMVFEYLGGAVGLTVSGLIHRSTLIKRFSHIPDGIISRETVRKLLDNPQLVNQEGLLSHGAEVTVRQVFAESFLFTFKILITFAAVLFLNAFFVARKEYKEEEIEEKEEQ
ncbi:hypothetical protein FQN54_005112 [Arachnomyces sp. PD_36]|nr:hypothetical protein FQN54_005112 [Arachnomyces sp. PD_36]